MLNIYCFKWGTKYDHVYVNRLYGSLVKHLHIPFQFFCITDNPKDIHKQVNIIDYSNFENTKVFTSEKLKLMYDYNSDNNLLLDLDILIHNDITEICFRDIHKPTFIWTHWTPKERLKLFQTKTQCFINSSFVRWKGDNAKFLYEHFIKNKKDITSRYDSCDKYLFYEHWPNNTLDFWEDGIFYNYNNGNQKYKFNKNAKCCIFNTSHLIKTNRLCLELADTFDWSMDIWESYDKID